MLVVVIGMQNPTSFTKLSKILQSTINTRLNTKVATVEVGSAEFFLIHFVHMTGH
jgi:hypothetical protein